MSGSTRILSVWSLPWHTLRLAGRCFLPLLMWFSAGQLIRFGLLVGGTEMSHGSWPQVRYALTMLVFVIMVMVSLIVSVGTFYSLRGGLEEMRARRAGGDEDEGFVGGISRVIIPYVALYLTWGWHIDDVREFINVDVTRQSAEKGFFGAWADFTTGQSQGTATGLIGLNFTTTLIIMAAAFVLRFFFMTWHDSRGSRVAALGTAFSELAFFYYGAQVVVSRGTWVGDRSASSWWGDTFASIETHVPGWGAFWGFIDEYKPFAWDALVLPAAWLTVAILIYGAYSEDAKAVIANTRVEPTATQVGEVITERTHSLTRQALGRLFGRWGHWLPILNTVRLTVRGGAPLFGLFVVCFAAIKVGEDYGFRGLLYAIGTDHPFLYWDVLLLPVNLGLRFIVTTLTACLLAATFDIAATRDRASRGAGVSGRSAEQIRRPVFPQATAPAPSGSLAPSAPR